MSQQLQPFKLGLLLTAFSTMQRYGVPYGYGAKAEGGSDPRDGHHWNPQSTGKIGTPLSTIHNIDCSGLVRRLSWDATDGKFVFKDGSQAQRTQCEEFFDQGLIRKVNYLDMCRYGGNRLFINFIRPGYHGCGPVGHVFYTLNLDKDPAMETVESYGGHGVGSRSPLTAVLKREVYSTYELPLAA